MKSRIRQIWLTQAAVIDTVSAEFNPQRLLDEGGVLHVHANQDPGSGAAGEISVEVALSKDVSNSWTRVAGIPLGTGTGTPGSGLSAGTPTFAKALNIGIYPRMRLAMRGIGGNFTPAANTTISAWTQE